jgi:UDP-N-acetylmuramoyl-tripeptide--D-alanyl-D-alanine ligase
LRFDILASTVDGTLFGAGLADRTFTGVSIDSRSLRRENLFVAIEGAAADGHDYIPQAVSRGASGLLTRSSFRRPSDIPETLPVVGVADTHLALMRLAAWYRAEIEAAGIAVTGSNGKTTTKEFTYRLLLAVEPRVYRSPGNFNNLYGLPLSILDMPVDTRVAVFELGISVPGEMARLAELVRPSLVAVTNVGSSHLEFLGTVEGVAREKLSLMRAAVADAPLVVNADNDILLAEAEKHFVRPVTFSLTGPADFVPDSVVAEPDGSTTVIIEGHVFHINLFGRHQVYNLLAAYAIVCTLGYSFARVDTEAIELTTSPLRGQILHEKGLTIIADCYNANPDSMASGLKTLHDTPISGPLYIVLGDMLELGADSPRFHRELGRELAHLAFTETVLVGPQSVAVRDGAVETGAVSDRIRHFAATAEAADYLLSTLPAKATIYIKGSRGIGLEKIIERLREQGGDV